MAKSKADSLRIRAGGLPGWIRPQLTKLMNAPPEGSDWLHEIKFDGYRMHARLDRGTVQLLTRNGLDWTEKYPAIASAVSSLGARQAYLDGELCGVRPDGTTSFSAIQDASDAGKSDALVFFLFDLLYLDGETIGSAPLIDRKRRLQELLATVPLPLQYTDHQIGRGPEFYTRACELSLEGIVSKRMDAPYTSGNRGLWVKTKCLNREEFVVVGWTDPRGLTTVPRSTLTGLLHPGRSIGLRRPRWRWHQQCGACATVARPATARYTRHATGCAAAAYQPFRVAARSQPGSLGATRACRRG
jgi:bifunctional non-homologous end joining protein LigD